MNTSWMDSAACRDESPELFTPRVMTRHVLARAQTICRACPVSFECDSYARATRVCDGIWAGIARGPIQGRQFYSPLEPCGTYAAYRRHERHGEKPCVECTTAYSRANYARVKARAGRRRGAS